MRRLQYEEIASVDPVRALHYLQTSLSESIDHSDPVQLREFHKLASILFRTTSGAAQKNLTQLKPASIGYPHETNMTNNFPQYLEQQPKPSSQQTPFISTSSSATSSQHNMPLDNNVEMADETPSLAMQMLASPYPSPQTPLGDCVTSTTTTRTVSPRCVMTRKQQAHALYDRFTENSIEQRRALLYNKIVSQLPEDLAQPAARLSDVASIDMDA